MEGKASGVEKSGALKVVGKELPEDPLREEEKVGLAELLKEILEVVGAVKKERDPVGGVGFPPESWFEDWRELEVEKTGRLLREKGFSCLPSWKIGDDWKMPACKLGSFSIFLSMDWKTEKESSG